MARGAGSQGVFYNLERRSRTCQGILKRCVIDNMHLDPLDRFVKERLRIRRYLRSMDDFCWPQRRMSGNLFH